MIYKTLDDVRRVVAKKARPEVIDDFVRSYLAGRDLARWQARWEAWEAALANTPVDCLTEAHAPDPDLAIEWQHPEQAARDAQVVDWEAALADTPAICLTEADAPDRLPDPPLPAVDDFKRKHYVEFRKAAYGPIETQLETIQEQGLAAWQDHCRSVKKAWPKPETVTA